MRFFKQAIVLTVIFSAFFSVHANAQLRDSLLFALDPGLFRTSPKVLGPINWNGIYTISPYSQKLISAIPNKQLQAMRAPSRTKRVNGPIILKQGGTCVSISCSTRSRCGDCVMLWNDANGDKKIQPRKELRCACVKSGRSCELTGKKVRCR